MDYTLRAGVYFCIAGDRPIFLDRNRDRYFALAGEKEASFLGLLCGSVPNHASSSTTELIDAGIIQHDRLGAPIAACSYDAPPSASLWDRDEPTSVWGRANAAASLFRATRGLRVSNLSTILTTIEDRKRALASSCRPDGSEVRAATAMAFRALGKVVASHNRCLPYSLAIMDRLLSRGVSADLVFGVAVRPFVAHCWVQQGGAILSDRLEHVRLFTPIMVI
ncbi:MAG: lasso peptide biosynthesis B2 protein [Pseudomonadota bacterium]|jgi:hypothetical protein|uniref:lasso peptide biosynthesis B2 protein n=1 Tax=Sphingomonadales TaxID=204457 RepID=UPI000DB3CAAF|nr:MULTISPECIES: lasso peptide biosynthesis B2 protein [Sphingomonadaceae]NLS28697.1 hypothetical protein [Sphingomonas sp. S2M10]PZU09456.1 MAG: lasso peptide biosynthesis B2 protein [Sphingobium sp.]